MTDIDLIKLALKALESCITGHIADGGIQWHDEKLVDKAITAIKEALADHPMREVQRLGQEIEQEPVAWGVDWGKAGDIPCVSIIKRLHGGGIEVVAVEYAPHSNTHPPQRTWVGLTDEEILSDDTLRYYYGMNGGAGPVSQKGKKVIAAIEAKLKQKNGYAEEKNT